MKIRIAFYKKTKTLFGKLILRQQRVFGIPERYAKYSHTEIVFMYKKSMQKVYDKLLDVVDRENIPKFGLSFSSSEQDGGCRFKAIDWNDDNWDFIEIEVSEAEYVEMLRFCSKENGNRYNKVGIFFAQILNFRKKRDGTWFCSEITTRALQQIKMLCPRDSLFTKPAELAMALEEDGHTIISF